MLKEAASRGLVMAEYRLAKLYERGEGVPRDMAASRSWTEKAAIGGNRPRHARPRPSSMPRATPDRKAMPPPGVERLRTASDLGLVDSQSISPSSTNRGSGSATRPKPPTGSRSPRRAGDHRTSDARASMLGDMQPTQAEAISARRGPLTRNRRSRAPMASSAARLSARRHAQQVSEVQRLLQRLNDMPRDDWRTNTRTAEAIRQFERANDLPVTGEASASRLRPTPRRQPERTRNDSGWSF